METNRLVEAQEAVRAIGAKRALPKLIDLVRTKDSRVNDWLVATSERLDIKFFHWHHAWDFQAKGLAGFEALGTNAAPAVGELNKLLDDSELSFVAVRCLANIGKPAELALCRALTNSNWQVREMSITELASVTKTVEVYLVRIKDSLKDTHPAVRSSAIDAVGAQLHAPELALPPLRTAIPDPDENVSAYAISALSGFGTNAVDTFSLITNICVNGRRAEINSAFKTLAAISPPRAIPILSNAVVNGSADTIIPALNPLKSVAPDLTLKLALDQFHSDDSHRRLRAFNFIARYELETPGIVEVIKSAAADSDSKITNRAAGVMMQKIQERKEKNGRDIVLPNEPSYQGKLLSDWLKMRNSEGEFSTNAVLALQQMGTNIFPALLARLVYREPIFNLYDYDVSMCAVSAFIAMHEKAKPALPALVSIMENSEDESLAVRAMLATLGTGADAMPILVKGLTHPFANVRNEAANFLTAEFGAQFPVQQKEAIPHVKKLLDDPDADVRQNVLNDLTDMERQARAKTGRK